ncbi:ferredoxin [Streptomyces prasinus]
MRPDNRLTDGAPMRPLACGRCAAEVLVRKSSWQQTSVQWDARATAACAERDPAGGAFEGCRSLRDTIREAALRGTLEVVDGGERSAGAAGRVPEHRA